MSRQYDEPDDWQATDSGYHERVEQANDLCIPGSGQTQLVERLT